MSGRHPSPSIDLDLTANCISPVPQLMGALVCTPASAFSLFPNTQHWCRMIHPRHEPTVLAIRGNVRLWTGQPGYAHLQGRTIAVMTTAPSLELPTACTRHGCRHDPDPLIHPRPIAHRAPRHPSFTTSAVAPQHAPTARPPGQCRRASGPAWWSALWSVYARANEHIACLQVIHVYY